MTPAAAEASAEPTTARTTPGRATFAALRVRNFRVYATGQAFANTGVWVQNIALDWLTLELTGSPAAVGLTMALTFLPILLFGMHGGMIADRYPKRNILLVTQACSATVATTLAVLTISGHITVGAIYGLALVTGFIIALDNPTRQSFVGEVVPPQHLRNAVALNAAVFQTTRLVGPALSSVLIGTVGSGWAFAVNALLYVGPTITLASLRTAELQPAPAVPRAKGQLRSALRYVAERPHVGWTIALVGVFGTFGLNFPVVLTAMASETFHSGAGLYGTFNIVLAVGSIAGALIAGGRSHSRLRLILLLGAAFGLAQTLAALAPNLGTFTVTLVLMGVTNLAFQAIANSSVQLWVDHEYRGRVMGLYALVFMGGTPLGGPLVGWITEHVGVRAGMAVCGIVPLVAAVAVAAVLAAQPVLARRRAGHAALVG
ncbi:MFS transporter [Kineococcus rhizosphaerae]|uniref:Putative MFS family arabinose efflux permease n=1 Tax=Kineococcus rhizosphaerae TaxID=559628 RepID=A0A2T0QXW5_9ACTN|nr:MFS transporter [Kineococcus rhizosphaerae]PRY10840.1 putative MFS family arabinose efflux permease [Kineococcus rhizosphaerae]